MPVPPRAALRRASAEARTALRSATRPAIVREGALQLLVVAVGVAQWVVGDGDLGGSTVVVAASTVLTCGVLLARHVWPTAALAATSVLTAGSVLVAWSGVPVVAFAAGRQLPRVRLWTATAVTAAVAALVTVVAEGYQPEEWPLVVMGWALFVLLMLVVPAGCGALVGQRRPAGRLLRERNAHLERTRELTAARARVEERARIAGEMHDMLGHRLSLLSVHAGALELRAAQQAPAVSEQARLIRGTAGTALAELRQILQLTHGTGAAAAGAATLAVGSRSDVDALVQRSREAGLPVTLTWVGDGGEAGDAVDPRTRQAVHRAVREGLTNVHKHAPATPAVRVEVAWGGGRARATVTNAAPTPGAQHGPGTRRGLVGLEERAALLGGTCHSYPTGDGGFVLVLDVPTAPTGSAVPDTPVPDVADLLLAEPPPLREAELMSTWRLVAVLALGALLAVPVVILGLAALSFVLEAVLT